MVEVIEILRFVRNTVSQTVFPDSPNITLDLAVFACELDTLLKILYPSYPARYFK